jgi:hypothetical protein
MNADRLRIRLSTSTLWQRNSERNLYWGRKVCVRWINSTPYLRLVRREATAVSTMEGSVYVQEHTHVACRHHFLRDHLEGGAIQLWIGSTEPLLALPEFGVLASRANHPPCWRYRGVAGDHLPPSSFPSSFYFIFFFLSFLTNKINAVNE